MCFHCIHAVIVSSVELILKISKLFIASILVSVQYIKLLEGERVILPGMHSKLSYTLSFSVQKLRDIVILNLHFWLERFPTIHGTRKIDDLGWKVELGGRYVFDEIGRTFLGRLFLYRCFSKNEL